MGNQKRDHYHPMLLQRRFAGPDGLLFVFDKRRPGLGVRQIGPRDLYVHKHLYSNVEADGTRRRELDEFYKELESVAAPVVDKIATAARDRRPPTLSADERAIWDLFIYNQWRRVPDSYQRFPVDESNIRALLADYERDYRPLTNEERSYWAQPQTITRLRHNAHVDELKSQSDKVLRILGERGLCIAVIEKSNKSFVTGSFPVVKLTNPETPRLDHASTETWIAIASDVAVALTGERGQERLVVVEDRHVRGLNEALFKQSTSTIEGAGGVARRAAVSAMVVEAPGRPHLFRHAGGGC